MGTSTCLLLLGVVLVLGLIVVAWEIVEAILHVAFHIVEGCIQWPVILLVLAGLVAVWIFFLR